jgi:hypothetical protein
MRATYRRLQGVRHFLGFYDVHRDCLGGVFRRRKRISDLLAGSITIRAAVPSALIGGEPPTCSSACDHRLEAVGQA